MSSDAEPRGSIDHVQRDGDSSVPGKKNVCTSLRGGSASTISHWIDSVPSGLRYTIGEPGFQSDSTVLP